MGVPDWFWLPERYNDAYCAMGDAVAVPVVRWLGDHLLTPLAERACSALPARMRLARGGRNDCGLQAEG